MGPSVALLFVLFVVLALVVTGDIHRIGSWATGQVGDDSFLAATGLLFGSAVLGAFFDNVPYVATMAPIVQDIVATAPDPETGRSPWWSFALGADGGRVGLWLTAVLRMTGGPARRPIGRYSRVSCCTEEG